MADECTESSVATSSTPPNWWDNHNHNHHHQYHHHLLHHHHHGSVSASLDSYNSQWSHQNPNSNSSCDEDVSISTSSFTNASNHSGLTLDSSNHLLPDNHLWTQLLLNIGNGVELESNDGEIGEKFLEAISSKNISTTGIFEPAGCSDYLKKMDTNNNINNWNTSSVPSFNNNNSNNGLFVENERLLKLSNLVNTWSIGLPSPEAAHLGAGTVAQAGIEPCGSGALFRRGLLFSAGNNNINNNNNGFHNQFYGMQEVENPDTRNFADYISFNGRLPKPVINVHASNNPCFKKQIHLTSSSTRISGRGSGVSSEGKKKRSEESSETATKKTKQENSTSPSNKMPQAKVKIGDRITALQQIVSPFGKTDTASVLTETIGYIKFLQEQVQLLSNPYMKTNSYKDPWQSLERKDAKGDGKIDLRSRGLCLVPISCTPEVYRENTGSDYWTPYRGCFYR